MRDSPVVISVNPSRTYPGYRREWPVQADAACKYGKQENISPKPGDSFESVHNRDIQSAAR